MFGYIYFNFRKYLTLVVCLALSRLYVWLYLGCMFGATFYKGCRLLASLIYQYRLRDFFHDFIFTLQEGFLATHGLSHHLHIDIV